MSWAIEVTIVANPDVGSRSGRAERARLSWQSGIPTRDRPLFVQEGSG